MTLLTRSVAVAMLFGGFTIGLVVTGWLEPILEPILALFAEPPKYILVPVDYNPFPDEIEI